SPCSANFQASIPFGYFHARGQRGPVCALLRTPPKKHRQAGQCHKSSLLRNQALPCTLVVQPVNSFSCLRAKDSLWDADRTRLRWIHGNGSSEAAGGREFDRDESRGRG